MTDHKKDDRPEEKKPVDNDTSKQHSSKSTNDQGTPDKEGGETDKVEQEKVKDNKKVKDALSRNGPLFGFILGLLLAVYFFLELVIIFLLVFIGMVIGGNPKRVNTLKEHIGESVESFKKILKDE